MEKGSYESLYKWEELQSLVDEFLPELVERQLELGQGKSLEELPREVREELDGLDFREGARDPREVARYLIDRVYPYGMRVNHPRYFGFIPNHVSPYSVFGDFLNSLHNPYGGGYSISESVATIETGLVKWMGEKAGYDPEKLGGQFVSGGSMANLTALVVARDHKLEPGELTRATVYVSDQTHSSVAKALKIIGLPMENIRKIPSDENFIMKVDSLLSQLEEDKTSGLKPFLLVGSCGTTNTGSIDPLEELGKIAEAYDLWYHVDGAFGASALLSSHREKLRGIETSDSLSWDGHKWLFQTYGCATVICRDKMKMVDSFHANPEYLEDVKSSHGDFNFWDMGIELTKPARAVRLFYTLQTVGLAAMRAAIDRAFEIAQWFEEEVGRYSDFEIVSGPSLGIINFRYGNSKYGPKELDEINREISRRALKSQYATYFTTRLKGKTVLRFCCLNSLLTREEVNKIIGEIRGFIGDMNI